MLPESRKLLSEFVVLLRRKTRELRDAPKPPRLISAAGQSALT
jgi:hypothetical protein